MTKAEFVDKIAKDAGIPKTKAEASINSLIDGIKTALKKGKTVTLVGFGTFTTAKRKARTGRNPLTGATLKIAAARVPKFRAGKALKDAVKKG